MIASPAEGGPAFVRILTAALLGCALAAAPASAQMDLPPRISVPTVPANPLDRVGLLDNARSGMPAWMWQGTSMGLARVVLIDLPAAPQSRVLRDLQFRVLITSATPPRPDAAEPSLFTLRVEKLAAMAEAESANELLRNASGRESAVTSRLVTEALMRVDQRDSACARVKAADDRFTATWWQEAAIVCHLHAREKGAARTKLDALRARPDVTPGFVGLAMRVLDGGPAPAISATEDGLILALIAIAGLPPPMPILQTPGALRAAIENKALPLALRVEIAEQAERMGAMEPERLADYYGELARSLKSSPATTPTAWRAVVFAQAQGAMSNEQRVVLPHRLYEVSRDTAGSAIRALTGAIASARPTQEHADFATAGFLATLTLDRLDRAVEWLAAVQEGPQAGDRIALLAPLASIARLPGRPPLTEKMMARRAELRPRTASALHALLVAMEVAPREELAPLLRGPSGAAPDPAIAALRAAAEAGRFAETICRAVALAGATPVADLDPARAAAITRALLLINRRDEARMFALEYAILAGL